MSLYLWQLDPERTSAVPDQVAGEDLVPAVLVLLFCVPVIVLAIDGGVSPYLSLSLLAAPFVVFVPVHFPWHFSEFGVTDKGFLIKMGIVGRHTLEALLAKVENIRVAQRLWGRLFGYKTIYATGTG